MSRSQRQGRAAPWECCGDGVRTAEDLDGSPNTYAAAGSFTPVVTTRLGDGRDLAADEFEFELKEGATVLQTVKTPGVQRHDSVHAAISYTLDDVGGTCPVRRHRPKASGLGGVTDDTGLTVTYVVTVSDTLRRHT